MATTTEYVPHDWALDDDITEADLDHLEQGVKAATDGVRTLEDAHVTVQYGSGSQTVASNAEVEVEVTFGTAFGSAPKVTISPLVSSNIHQAFAGVKLSSVTTTGFTAILRNTSASPRTVGYSYIAAL